MISKDEILAFADETGLTPNVAEKDYVLGWLLAAINTNPVLSQSWVFKGGTCLKKCYFETYRFSEDLDFTLRDQTHINEVILKEQFTSVAEWLYEETGIEIPTSSIRFPIYIFNPVNSYLPVFQPGRTGLVLGCNMLAILSPRIDGLKRIKIGNSEFEWTV